MCLADRAWAAERLGAGCWGCRKDTAGFPWEPQGNGVQPSALRPGRAGGSPAALGLRRSWLKEQELPPVYKRERSEGEVLYKSSRGLEEVPVCSYLAMQSPVIPL